MNAEIICILLVLFILALYCPTSSLQPLADPSVGTTSNDYDSEVSSKETTEVTENNLKFTEIIQQIDVKDDGEQIIDNISNIIIGNEPINETNNDALYVDLNNINLAKVSILNDSIRTEDDDETPISWRSDIPKQKTIATKRLLQDVISPPNIFMFVNTGNIENISLDSKDLQLNTDTVKNLNSTNSTLINKINSTVNDVLSNLLHRNISNLNSKNVVLWLNSGNISNININSPNVDNSQKSSNISKLNNKKVKTHAKRPPSDDDYPMIDVRFRSDENNDTKNITNHVQKILHATEKPSKNKDNILAKLLPKSKSLNFDLPKTPVDDIFGTALDFIKRLKRDAIVEDDNDPWDTICNSSFLDEKYNVIFCGNPEVIKNDLKPESRSSNNILDLSEIGDDDEESTCSNSHIIKILTYLALDEIRDSGYAIFSRIAEVIKSLLEGNEAVIDLVSVDLFNIPFPLKLKLQLLHGETKEFINELSKYVDFILCQ